MKVLTSLAAGLIFVGVVVQVIGLGAAATMPDWLAVYGADHPHLALFAMHLATVAIPVFVLAAMTGAVLGRLLHSRAAVLAVVAMLPYVGFALYQELFVAPNLLTRMWFVPAPVFIAVVVGMIVGVRLFGTDGDSPSVPMPPRHDALSG